MYLELQGSTTVKKSLPSDLFVRNFSPIHVSTLCSPQSHLTLSSLLYYRYSKWPLPKRFVEKILYISSLAPSVHAYVTANVSFFILRQNIKWNMLIAVLLICDIYHVPIYLFIYFLLIYLFICAPINNTNCSLNYVAINDRIINEWIGKDVEGNFQVLIWGTILACVWSHCTILACVWNHCIILACVWRHCTILVCVWSHCTILACVWSHCIILACVWSHCTILTCFWSHCTILACVWRHWGTLQNI
jgi:hypothetical protein